MGLSSSSISARIASSVLASGSAGWTVSSLISRLQPLKKKGAPPGVDEYLNCEMEMGKCNRKVIERRIGKKIKWERREGQKTEGKDNQMGKKEKKEERE